MFTQAKTHKLGIEDALGKDFEGKLALWQVMARGIGQGSRLSAVRLAQIHAAGDVLDMKRGFDSFQSRMGEASAQPS